MAVGVVMDFDGATIDQYDGILKLMNRKAGGPAPSGCLFHWVTKTDKGMRVTDVWQTKEQFEKFAQEHINQFQQPIPPPPP